MIIAGEAGTGKTHLAVAIAIEVMKSGRKTIYRTVDEIMDELTQKDNDDDEDFKEYLDLKNEFSNVPCLVVDGFCEGNANNDRGMCDLYAIIDRRYVYGLQTIITINAINPQEVKSWGSKYCMGGIVSRMLERGTWVVLEREL